MTLLEILKAKGVADDVIASIVEDMKANKIFTAGEENLDVRYSKLKTDHEGLTKQLAEANTLIDGFKKSEKGNEALQGKITAYEGQVAELQKQLNETKLNAAVKVALLSEKALDVDYLTFKLKAKGDLSLDENEKIKGWDDKISALKTQFPTQFESATGRKVDPQKLSDPGNKDTGYTKAEILKKPYAERAKLFEENPEAYEAAMKK